jgi:DNA invertase Pin-like site-specific DNA recombinase
MNKTIEISRQAALDMMPCLEGKLVNLEGAIAGLEAERASLKTTIAELRAKLNGGELPLKNGKYTQRLPKGHGEKLVIEVLKSLPEGQGLSMAEIVQKTGVKHSTVYRTLGDAKRNKGRFVAANNQWRLATK